MTFRSILVLLFCLAIPLQWSCTYSFKGFIIDVNSYYVGQFKITALNAPATINQTFAESLKDKISRESKLVYTEDAPDLEFNGSITRFAVEAKAPLPGEQTAFNRLTITVSVEYINHKNADDTWTRNFEHFEDFDPNQNLLQVQDELITIIFNQILEDIFNQAFNNW